MSMTNSITPEDQMSALLPSYALRRESKGLVDGGKNVEGFRSRQENETCDAPPTKALLSLLVAFPF
jgi:hypothetical protein